MTTVSTQRASERAIQLTRFSSSWRLCELLMLIPFIYLLWVVCRYSVEVPYADQWELVPVLEKSYRGELSFGDLWSQHNEHRIFFPRLIMLALAHATHWRIGWELLVNIVLALGFMAVLIWQIRRTARTLDIDELRWALPAGSLLVFSVSQYQNWLWGWQIQVFLSLLAVTGGIVLLANGRFTWVKFVAAAMLGFMASHSFANGILFWPVGLVVLLRSSLGSAGSAGERPTGIFRWPHVAPVLLWIFLALLTLGSFLLHYEKPRHSTLTSTVKQPLDLLIYAVKYLGSLCAQYGNAAVLADSVLAIAFGVAAMALLGWAVRALVWKNKNQEDALRPYLALSAYSILSALMTGIGRAGFGSEQAMESRYCTLTVPLWISLVVFLIVLTRAESSKRKFARLAQWALAVILVFAGLSSFLSLKQALSIYEARSEARTYLLQLGLHPGAKPDIEELLHLYPARNPGVVVDRLPVLVRERLSLFTGIPAEQPH